MFDDIPIHFWLLIGIGVLAYPSARYAARHIANSPSRYEITQARPDLSWRTSAQLLQSLVILGLLAGLAIFIFTPAAEGIARSPKFWPALIVTLGVWSLYTVSAGLISGRIEPMIKGLSDTYERELQPKRYWASLIWNGTLGILLLWVAYQTSNEASADAAWDQCFDGRPRTTEAARSACIDRIAAYDDKIRRDPTDYALRHNRGLVHRRLGNNPKASEDFSAAIRLQPDDPDAYLERGLIYLESQKLEEAILDFGRAHELDPKDPWALANRGVAYAWNQDEAKAEKDFAAAHAIDPSNVVVLRGRAVLSMQKGDLQTAVTYLSAALQRDPDNEWALRTRAWHFRQLGEPEKAQADEDRLRQLTAPATAAQRSGD